MGVVLQFPTNRLDRLHDAYIEAVRAFQACPSPEAKVAVLRAYEAFYDAFVEDADESDRADAMDWLRRRLEVAR